MLTLEQKKYVFNKLGRPESDAEKFDIDDSGMISPIATQPQAVQPQQEEDKVGKMEAIGLSLKSQALPLAGAVGTRAAVMAAAPAVASALGYTLAPIPSALLGIGSMVLGGLAADKAQRAAGFIDQEREAKARQDQFLTSLAADLAPMAVLARPSVSNIREAYKTAKNVPTMFTSSIRGNPLTQVGGSQKAVSPEAVENLANIAVGVGLPATMRVAAPLIRGEEVDWKYAIPEMAAGALLNQPRFGGAARKTEVATPEQLKAIDELKRIQEEVPEKVNRPPESEPSPEPPMTREEVERMLDQADAPEDTKPIRSQDVLEREGILIEETQQPLSSKEIELVLNAVAEGKSSAEIRDILAKNRGKTPPKSEPSPDLPLTKEESPSLKLSPEEDLVITREEMRKILEQVEPKEHVIDIVRRWDKEGYLEKMSPEEYGRLLYAHKMGETMTQTELFDFVHPKNQYSRSVPSSEIPAETKKKMALEMYKEEQQKNLIGDRLLTNRGIDISKLSPEEKKAQIASIVEANRKIRETTETPEVPPKYTPLSAEEIASLPKDPAQLAMEKDLSYAYDLASRRAVKAEVLPAEQVIDAEGRLVGGKISPRPSVEAEQLAQVAEGPAAPQNMVHETMHALYQQLTKEKNRNISNYEKSVINNPEFIKARNEYEAVYGKGTFGPEEFMVTRVTPETFAGLREWKAGKQDATLKDAFDTIKNAIKRRFGTAKLEDYQYWIKEQMLSRRPYREEFSAYTPKVSPVAAQAESPEKFSRPVIPEPIKQSMPPEMQGIDMNQPKAPQESLWSQVKRVFTPEISNIKDEKLRLALSEVLARVRAYVGWTGNYLQNKFDELKLSRPERSILVNALLAERRAKKSMRGYLERFGSAMTEAYDETRRILKAKQEDQIKAGQLVFEDGRWREAKIDPFYFPMMAERKVLETLLSYPDSPEALKLHEDFIKYQMKYNKNASTRPQAEELYNEYLNALSDIHTGDPLKFGAVRKAEGLGLPDSWLDKDLDRVMERYWNRVAMDRSWHDVIETDPYLAEKVGYAQKDPTTGEYATARRDREPAVANVIRRMQGFQHRAYPVVEAISRLSNAMIVSSPLSGFKDFMSSLAMLGRSAPSVKSIVDAYIEGATKMRSEGFQKGIQTGVLKNRTRTFDELYGPRRDESTFLETLNNSADFLFKISGRQSFEQWARSFLMASSKPIIAALKDAAEAGDPHSIYTLNKLSNKTASNRKWDLSNDELAARLTETFQGTYDMRSLPGWVIDSQFAPLFKLSRWSIDQAVQFYRHVLVPAGNWNFKPLMISTAGGMLTGFVTKEIVNAITGQQNREPDIKEIKSANLPWDKEMEAKAYKAIALATYSGVAGILGDLARLPFDMMYGNKPNAVRNSLYAPLADAASKYSSAIAAAKDDPTLENTLRVFLEATKDLTKTNFQLGRHALQAHDAFSDYEGYKAEQKRLENLRNLRTFKALRGEAAAPYTGTPSYKDLAFKDFKRERDPAKAMAMLPEIMDKVVRDSKGDPEKLQSILRGLKVNSYQTIPNPERNPQMASEFYDFLTKVHGEPFANAVYEDYFRQTALNRAKSQMIP